MKLKALLEEFYTKNGLPANGGVDKKTFEMSVFGFLLKLPNPSFRKEVIHIHDIQHILNDCDTSWKGEGFIAGWEIATGLWRYFPISIFSFWAMGYSLWLHPKMVFQGYKKGLNNIGIIDLKVSEADFLEMEFNHLLEITSKKNKVNMTFLHWMTFLFWVLISQIVLFFPLVLSIFIVKLLLVY